MANNCLVANNYDPITFTLYTSSQIVPISQELTIIIIYLYFARLYGKFKNSRHAAYSCVYFISKKRSRKCTYNFKILRARLGQIINLIICARWNNNASVAELRGTFRRLIVPPVSLDASKRTSLNPETRILHRCSESWSPTVSPLLPSRPFAGPDVCSMPSP